MKKLSILLLALLFVVCTASAQAPATAEPNSGDKKVELGVAYLLLTDGPGTTSVTVANLRWAVSDRFSGVYSQFQIPAANAQIYIGSAEFREKLSHLFKSKGTAQTNFEKIELFGRAGVGSRRDSNGNSPSIAYLVGGGFAIRVRDADGNIPAVYVGSEIYWLRAPLVKQSFVITNSPTAAFGLSFRW